MQITNDILLGEEGIGWKREQISFDCDTADCVGFFYSPSEPHRESTFPAVVMAPGIGSLKEMGLTYYAIEFAKHGFAVLLFDFRHWGKSGGEPRCQAIPNRQVEDYRHALTYLAARPDIDEQRLGVWGTSFSGAIALQVAALDNRIQVVVSQTPPTDMPRILKAQNRSILQKLSLLFLLVSKTFFSKEKNHYIPIANIDGADNSMMGDETYHWQIDMQQSFAPHFENKISIDSLWAIAKFAPIKLIDQIAPKPVLIIAAKQDTSVPFNTVRDAYAKALEPKKMVELEAGHYGVYYEVMETACSAAISWFKQHL